VSGWYKDTPAGEIGEDYEEGTDLSEYVLDDGPDPDLVLSQDQADSYYVEE